MSIIYIIKIEITKKNQPLSNMNLTSNQSSNYKELKKVLCVCVCFFYNLFSIQMIVELVSWIFNKTKLPNP